MIRLATASLRSHRRGGEASARFAREFSAVDLTEAYLERIEQFDGELGVYLHVMRDVALAQAAAADRRLATGDASPLTGIPMALKDVLCTIDAPTTAGSRILEGFRPPYDATVVRRLREQGAVFLGKANTDEFAMGSSNENSAFKPVRIRGTPIGFPGEQRRARGGGRRQARGSQPRFRYRGIDPSASRFLWRRRPEADLRPCLRLGLIAFASSLDQIGPFARTVEDAAITLQAIAGHDPQDSTSSREAVPDYRAALSGDISGMKIGVARNTASRVWSLGWQARWIRPLERLRSLGAELVSVSLPHTEYALPTYYITAPAEASANLARYDGVKYGLAIEAPTLRETYERTRGEGFGPEVKRRIMLGTYALSSGYYDAYYVKAQKVRTLIKRDFDEAWARSMPSWRRPRPRSRSRSGHAPMIRIKCIWPTYLPIPANMAGIPG